MKTEQIFYSGEYKRHAIGFAILLTIVGFPFIYLLIRVGIDMAEQKELLTYLLSISPIPVIAYLGIRKLVEKREVKVSESGILYGRTMRPWSDIKALKPLKQIGRSERKYHLMCIYKGIASIGVKIPLQVALTNEEYRALADELNRFVKPHYTHLTIKEIDPVAVRQ